MKIYFHTMTETITSRTSLENVRSALALSAESLFGKCSDEWLALHESLSAVLLPGDIEACD